MLERVLVVAVLGLLLGGGPSVLAEQAPDRGRTLASSTASAQDEPLNFLDSLDVGGALGGLGGGDHLTLAGGFQLLSGSREGRLFLTAESEPGWHVYSITQLDGGPQRTQITVDSAPDFELTGNFQADTAPRVKTYEFFKVPVEEHPGTVTWTAPIRLAEGVEPQKLVIRMRFSGQICQDDGVCIPISNREVAASFAGELTPSPAAEGYRGARTHVTLRGEVRPRVVRPGERLTLRISAEPDGGWHVYAYADRDPEQVSKPTLIVLTNPAEWRSETPVASKPPVPNPAEPSDTSSFYYEGAVDWTWAVQVPRDAVEGEHEIRGLIGYQTCTESTCDAPTAAEFRAVVSVASQPDAAAVALEFSPARYTQAAQAAAKRDETATTAPESERSATARPDSALGGSGLDLSRLKTAAPSTSGTPALVVLVTAFVAGFLLNFMPCVLPVIGLKVMAFVQQAGDSRGRVFWLNLWYSLGLMSVFLVLATLAVTIGLSWGQQFSSATFNVVLNAVIFVFALSFLGVWEIPIPGFVGSGEVQSLGEREGPTGAFAKGVLTTILATPCSGPMLTPALTWAVSQPPAITYAGFACVGLGMASPYLTIGVFPRLIAFLPKPGAWMETFKNVMGFVLMGTVVFLLTFMPIPYVVPTVAFLIGLWAAFWWIGRTSLVDPFQVRLRAWLAASTFALLIGLVSYTWLLDIMESRFQRAVDRELSNRGAATAQTVRAAEGSRELPWQPFSLSLLEKLTADGHTVLVDFTADW